MSHIRVACANCGAPKAEDALYEPYCQDCQLALVEARKQADEAGAGKALYDMMKHNALTSRSSSLGMAGKADPRTPFDRFSTEEFRRRMEQA